MGFYEGIFLPVCYKLPSCFETKAELHIGKTCCIRSEVSRLFCLKATYAITHLFEDWTFYIM